jgi:[acyl-carrier-protein] S-malonyltransferase
VQKFGFIFPGQGSQKLGMLSTIAGESSIIESTFEEASDVLGADLWEICQEDHENILDQTEITQPALLSASVAVWRFWQGMTNLAPSIMAGHSLGEYSALVCADSLGFCDAIRIVHERGKLMQAAVAEGQGKMAAIIGLTDKEINRICDEVNVEKGVVSAANYNSPTQTVIAGDAASVKTAMDLCKDAGAKKVLLLNVSVPSHCSLMRPAAQELQNLLASVELNSPVIPVLQNTDGSIAEEPEQIKRNLVKQLYSPVLWVDCVKAIFKEGSENIVECGPGKVLSSLVKRIEPKISCYASDTTEQVLSAISGISRPIN